MLVFFLTKFSVANILHPALQGSRNDCTLLEFGPKSGKMRVFVILSCAVMMANAGGYYPNLPKRVFQTYGRDVVRNGTCPISPDTPCGMSNCEKDNHCKESSMKCCPGVCGFLLCLDAVPGERTAGECPEFWNVPVEYRGEEPINRCEIDAECKDSHKCCDTDTSGIRKCVLPKA